MTEAERVRWLVDHDDYVSGQTPDDQAKQFEARLFAVAAGASSAAGAHDETVFYDRLARVSAWLSHDFAAFRGGSTRAEVEELLRSGKRVFFQELGSGGGIVALRAWPADTQMVVTRLGVDLRGYRDVEVDVSLGEGPVLKTFRECEYDPTDGAIYAVCHEPLARIAFGHPRVLARVTAVRDAGRETVAVYDARAAEPSPG